MSLLVFAVTLLVSVLLSELAHKSILSAAVMFLVVGFLAGDGVLGWVSLKADDPVVSRLIEVALFTVLFTDGMRVGLRDLRSAWKLPGRALLLGLPLTWLGTGVLARYVAGLPWVEALLVGAVLSPTDPVFAAAIVGREEVPARLRHLLNVESGLNDGLALPLVMTLLALLGAQEAGIGRQMLELTLGLGLGWVVPWVAVLVERSRFFAISKPYEPLFALALGLLVFGVANIVKANEYLAAFAAGITLATVRPESREEFGAFGEFLVELLKLAALLVFGALLSPAFFTSGRWGEYLFVFLTILFVRPAALGIALAGARLDWPERVSAAWFGPKGFASVFFGLMVLGSGAKDSGPMFHLIALVVTTSIIAHSSTDVVVARWFRKTEGEARANQAEPAEAE